MRDKNIIQRLTNLSKTKAMPPGQHWESTDIRIVCIHEEEFKIQKKKNEKQKMKRRRTEPSIKTKNDEEEMTYM